MGVVETQGYIHQGHLVHVHNALLVRLNVLPTIRIPTIPCFLLASKKKVVKPPWGWACCHCSKLSVSQGGESRRGLPGQHPYAISRFTMCGVGMGKQGHAALHHIQEQWGSSMDIVLGAPQPAGIHDCNLET